MAEIRVLETAAEITPEIEKAIEETVDWFDGEATMGTQEFIDRLCDTYGDEWDLESYDNPAARRIMKIAREIRRERAL